MYQIPVFIDTDIGDDIDDAIALTYALLNPKFQVVGVSTVGYAGAVRAGLVSALLRATSRDLPVAVGSERASTNPGSAYSGQIQWAARHLSPASPKTDPADLLYSLARAHDGELHLVTLGPLTNIESAFERYPKLPEMLSGMHIMGGELSVFRREHNFAADYVAAAQVIEQGRNVHLSTWSVGTKLRFDEALQGRLKDDERPWARLLCDLIAAWGFGHPPVLYDVVPFLHLERPEVVPSKEYRLVVETKGTYTRGVTVDVSEHATGLPLYAHLGEQPQGSSVRVSTDVLVPQARAMLFRVFGLEGVSESDPHTP